MLTCKFCWNDIDYVNVITYTNVNNSNVVFDYCIDCLTSLLDTLWDNYIKMVKSCDCKVSLHNLISIGPPFYFRDEQINEGKDIVCFYYNGNVIDGRVRGSLDIKYKDSLMEKLNHCDLYVLNIDDILNI